MEILQSLWNMLVTENELVVKIASFPLVFVESLLTTLIFVHILDIAAEKKKILIYSLVFSCFGYFINLFVPAPYNSFLNVIICPILVILIFKTPVFKAILAEIIPYTIFVLIGSIVLNICIHVFYISTEMVVKIPLYKLITSFFIYIIVFAIYLILKSFNISIKLLDTMKKKRNTIILVNIIVGIIAIGVQGYVCSLFSEALPFYVIILNISTLLLYFVFSLYSLIRTNKLEATEQNLEQSKQYINTLTILHDSIRGFKHDFANIVTTIGGYVQSDNMEGLKTYYNELLKDCDKVNNLSTLNPDVINEPAIYSLLTSKYQKADELGISIKLEVFLNLNDLHMKVYEFTRILGILMDNAIEAASSCEEKIINVTIRKDFHQNRQLLVIENTYSDKDIDTDKIFEKGFSTKPNNTGLGLWEVKQILKKHNNLNLFTSKDEKLFKQQLEIYY